jgi:lipopolysaccharide transport system permease protein
MVRFGSKRSDWWEFLLTMTEREIKLRYKLSTLGLFWIILNPIIQIIIIGFIFKFFTPLQTENYLLYLFSGLIMWNFFSSSLSRSTPAIINERYLLKKAMFPRETIILSIVLSNFIQLIISIVLLILVTLVMGAKINALIIVLLPLALLVFLLFTLGCSLFLGALNVRHRDTNLAINFLISIWFYVTPIIYISSMLPREISKWLYLNPLTGLMEFFRWVVLGIKIENWGAVGGDVILGLIIFLIGFFYFKKMSLDFDDWV